MNPRHAFIAFALGVLLTPALLFAEEAKSAPPATPAAPAALALDFGNFSSETITSKAWDSFNAKNHTHAMAYARKCIELYKDKAVEMQKSLSAPATVKEEVFKSWALNDVGTCYFILGQVFEAEGKNQEAIEAFKFLATNLSFAQCWDAKGWFWKPADAAREKVKALEFDALK